MIKSLNFAPTSFVNATSLRCRAAVAPPPPKLASSPCKLSSGSFYEVLRVKPTASTLEIKSAYRSLAKRYHPDASLSDGGDFMEIHNAYETLCDPAARAVYDMSLGIGSNHRFMSAYPSGWRRPTRRWETDQCW